jgi:hypothetical protein
MQLRNISPAKVFLCLASGCASGKGSSMNIRYKIRFLVIAAILIVLPALVLPAASFAQVGISITIGPPPLPVYAQPPCPAPGYAWTPGYWAYGPQGYFWVPGTWVVAPVGLLWTPGYWGWGGGVYLWHAGYWGPHVGFYGGINYGYGYGGVGFAGGYWNHGAYYYNRSVTNVNVTNVTNVYNKTVINNNTTLNRASFNGGTGGTTAVATPQELAASRERHTAPLAAQVQQRQLASSNRDLLASVNHGAPAIAATARPAQFSGAGVVKAQSAGAAYRVPAAEANATNRPNAAPSRNAVPRPPSSNVGGAQTATRPQNGEMSTSVPKPSPSQPSSRPSPSQPSPTSTQSRDVPRPPSSMTRPTSSYSQNSPSSSTPQTSRTSNVPRPPASTGQQGAQRSASQTATQGNSNVPRPQSPPRPESAMQGHPQGGQRQAPPRPESAPRNEGGERR